MAFEPRGYEPMALEPARYEPSLGAAPTGDDPGRHPDPDLTVFTEA